MLLPPPAFLMSKLVTIVMAVVIFLGKHEIFVVFDPVLWLQSWRHGTNWLVIFFILQTMVVGIEVSTCPKLSLSEFLLVYSILFFFLSLPSFLPLFLLSFQKRSLRTWIVCQPPSLTEKDTWVWVAIGFLGAGSRITGLTLRKGFSKPMKLALIPFCHERSPWRCFQQWELVSELPRVLSWWTDQWSQTMEPEPLYEVGHAHLLVGMHVSVKASMYPDRLSINVWPVDFYVVIDGPAIQKPELELCLGMWKRPVPSSKSQERRRPPWGHSLMIPQRVCYVLGDVCASKAWHT